MDVEILFGLFQTDTYQILTSSPRCSQYPFSFVSRDTHTHTRAPGEPPAYGQCDYANDGKMAGSLLRRPAAHSSCLISGAYSLHTAENSLFSFVRNWTWTRAGRTWQRPSIDYQWVSVRNGNWFSGGRPTHFWLENERKMTVTDLLTFNNFVVLYCVMPVKIFHSLPPLGPSFSTMQWSFSFRSCSCSWLLSIGPVSSFAVHFRICSPVFKFSCSGCLISVQLCCFVMDTLFWTRPKQQWRMTILVRLKR